MSIKNWDQDFAMLYWDTVDVPRDKAQAAFDKQGYGEMLPPVNHQEAVKKATESVLDMYSGIVKKGGKRLLPLTTNGGNCYGYEVRELIKGVKKNQLPFLFSVGVYEKNGNPDDSYAAIRDIAPAGSHSMGLDRLHGDLDKANECIDMRYQKELSVCTARDLTRGITRVVKANAGFMCRKGGVVWTMPKRNLTSYQGIAKDLDEHGATLTGGVFPSAMSENNAMIDTIAGQVKDYVSDIYGNLIADAKMRESEGIKSRSNGDASRLEKLQEADTLLTEWREAFGEMVEELDAAALKAREHLGIAAIELYE